MTLMIPEAEAVPLKTDPDGTVRVKGTRVILDLVIEAFNDGLTAEQIASRYDSLDLGDVYAVISYYLHHQEEVDAYLRQRAEEAGKIKQEIESKYDPIGLKKMLLARMAKKNNKE